MTSKKIRSYSVKASIFQTLSLLMGIGTVGSFLFLLSEGLSTGWKEELLSKLLAFVLLLIFVALYSIFNTLSRVYKKNIELALERRDNQTRLETEMKYVEVELEESRQKRTKVIRIDIPID